LHGVPQTPIFRAIMAEREEEKQSTGIPLHTQIFSGLLAGAIGGVALNLLSGQTDPRVGWVVANITEPVGQLFLRLLLMTVIPLVFSSLALGVAGIGNLRALGRVGLKTFGYTLVLSAISVGIGLTLANTVRPGKLVSPETASALEARYGSEAERRLEATSASGASESAVMKLVKSIVPANPLAAVASETPNMLHLMFFALILGVAVSLLPPPRAAALVGVLEAIYEATLKIIDWVMRLAPYAVACLVFNNTARFGLDLLQALGGYMVTVLAGLALHLFGVYSLSVRFLARMSPLVFFRRIRTVMLTAFSTSSSNATLPTALRVSETQLGVPRAINNFVLTVGATANQNGTALYEGVTVLFLAQLSGIELSLGQQIGVAYLAILGGVGTAGVPAGSIPFVMAVMATVGVNPALIAIILGVDRILDMCRTTLNVTGDLAAATYVARSEGYELALAHERDDGTAAP
jgi:DAACS family dicarboxylate/amino acid:cation (Na+ or H+) symporter